MKMKFPSHLLVFVRFAVQRRTRVCVLFIVNKHAACAPRRRKRIIQFVPYTCLYHLFIPLWTHIQRGDTAALRLANTHTHKKRVSFSLYIDTHRGEATKHFRLPSLCLMIKRTVFLCVVKKRSTSFFVWGNLIWFFIVTKITYTEIAAAVHAQQPIWEWIKHVQHDNNNIQVCANIISSFLFNLLNVACARVQKISREVAVDLSAFTRTKVYTHTTPIY